MNTTTHYVHQANNHYIKSMDLQQKVKDLYRKVAHNPNGGFHFETGRQLAERLGYPAKLLDIVPTEAVNSFAGVGYNFHMANLLAGERVIDLGCGSGMDSFFAAFQVGDSGHVTGVDMIDEPLIKAECLRIKDRYHNIRYIKTYIETIPYEDDNFDAVISNGVINLTVNKHKVFSEIARLLKPGGRLIVSDIVTTVQLPDEIVCNANLWADGIGGALHVDDYISAINSAGLIVESIQDNNEYQFISDSVKDTIRGYGIKSISIKARKKHSWNCLKNG